MDRTYVVETIKLHHEKRPNLESLKQKEKWMTKEYVASGIGGRHPKDE